MNDKEFSKMLQSLKSAMISRRIEFNLIWEKEDGIEHLGYYQLYGAELSEEIIRDQPREEKRRSKDKKRL